MISKYSRQMLAAVMILTPFSIFAQAGSQHVLPIGNFVKDDSSNTTILVGEKPVSSWVTVGGVTLSAGITRQNTTTHTNNTSSGSFSLNLINNSSSSSGTTYYIYISPNAPLSSSATLPGAYGNVCSLSPGDSTPYLSIGCSGIASLSASTYYVYVSTHSFSSLSQYNNNGGLFAPCVGSAYYNGAAGALVLPSATTYTLQLSNGVCSI